MEKSITIKIGKKTIKVLENQTILDALNNSGEDINWLCKQGICGSCILTVQSGRFKYISQNMCYTSKDQVTSCIAIPLEDITIKKP